MGRATQPASASTGPSAWRIVGIYTSVAALWIFGSDHLLALLYDQPDELVRWSVYKGIGFVVVTALLLLFLVRRAFRMLAAEQANTLSKERALRATEMRLAEIVNTATDAILALDDRRRIVLANAAAEQIFGAERTQLIGVSISDFVPGLAEAGVGGSKLLQVRGVDGTSVPVEASIAQTKGEMGTALTLILRDIRSRVEREKCLSQERARLIEAQEVANLGSWDIDFSSGEMRWSLQTYEIFAVDPTEFLPTRESVLALVHPDDRGQVEAVLARLRMQAPRAMLEHRLLLPDGSVRYLEQRWHVFKDDRGRLSRAAGTCLDITARRKAEDAQREQAVLLENAQRIGQMGSWSFDVASGRLLWSDATCALYGVATEAFRGTVEHFYEFIVAEDRPIVRDASAQANAGQPYVEVEYRIRRPDGTLRWMFERGVIEFDAAGRPVRHLGMVMDITERQEARQALQRSLDALGRRNRELQEFAYVASHDLQEPLRKIRTFSELLTTRHQEQLDDSARNYLDRMNRAAARMQKLIDDLLEYSRVATGNRPSAQVDLATICREVLADLEARIEATQARIHVAELPTIVADAVQMRQMFQNLLANALKFCDKERIPEIRISCESSMLGDEPAVLLQFCDNGIGFDPRFAEKIFEPFQRLHSRSEHEGTGMGLAIVRRLVERHGGGISAIGEPGVGARFSVILPAGSGTVAS